MERFHTKSYDIYMSKITFLLLQCHQFCLCNSADYLYVNYSAPHTTLLVGATLFYLGETAASISLALLCLLISYILMRFLSLLFILTFVSATFLLHQAVGPVAIFEWTFWAGSYFLEIFYFLLYHYYVTTICTVVLFGFAVTRRITRETDRHIIQDIRILMLSQTQSIGQLQNSLNTLNRRLVTMEGKQNEMKRTLDQMKTKLDRIQNVGEAGRPADEVMRPVDEADGPVGTSRAANSV